MAQPHVVIVGAGLAGAKTAEHLRDVGFEGRITLLGDESRPPYDRPPLSKDVLQGKAGPESAYLHPEQWYADNAIDLRLGNPVTGLDVSAKTVTTADGEVLDFDKLVIATGSSPRLLEVPGADLDGVHYLRRMEDAQRLLAAFDQGSSAVIIGGGWIGLEAAAAARAAGLSVAVLEAGDIPLGRVLGPDMAGVFTDLHKANGVDVQVNVQVQSLVGEAGRVVGVRLADGREYPADVVVVGVGIIPNTHLARSAGLVVDNGIVVDEHLRTAHRDVYAVGDVANAAHPVLGERIRVEHWANAVNQPAVAAAGVVGQEAVYDRLPYFYSDQYDVGMEYVGHAGPDDQVVTRGDVTGRQFLAFWVREGRVVAGMNVNVWDVVEDVRAMILSGRQVDVARLTDPAVPLSQV
jgi:3-phenylpropionate/trans-cinnamate dioxygenase ferredoxin reductase subunit